MLPNTQLTPVNGGRRERRRRETHARIFDAAMRLFSERGYANTPVEEITEAADVAKGTFFNYFPSKEAILEALAERQLGVVKAAEEKAREAASVHPVLLEMIHKLAERPSRSQLLLRSLMGVAMTHNTLSTFLGRVLDGGRGHVAAIMKRGQQLGELRLDLSPLELARVLQHAIFGTQMIWSLSARSDLNKWLDMTFEIFWRGVAAEAIPANGARAGSASKEKLL
jgi:AcrR family transcriptional regulator